MGCSGGAGTFFLHDVEFAESEKPGQFVYRARVDEVRMLEGLDDPDRLSWDHFMERVVVPRAIHFEGASLRTRDPDRADELAGVSVSFALVVGDTQVDFGSGVFSDPRPMDSEALPSLRFPGYEDDLMELGPEIEDGEFDVELVAEGERSVPPPALELILAFAVEGRLRPD
jgi:hypothetical protein